MYINQKNAIDLANLLRARFAYIYITTWEEERALDHIRYVAKNTDLIKTERKVLEWSRCTGFTNQEGDVIKHTKDPGDAIRFMQKDEEDAIYVLKDFYTFFGADHRQPDYDVVRQLRDALADIKYSLYMKNVIFLSPRLVIPVDMQKEIAIFDFDLPTEDELLVTLKEMISENRGMPVSLDEEGLRSLARGALGLTVQEAENAFARAIISEGCLNEAAKKIIFEEKNQVIKKTGILEFINSSLDINDIGGLDNMKKWLMKRNNSWGKDAQAYNIPAPKGVLITGVPGCGKSLTAKAMSSMWGLPLLKMDFGKIFSGIVGSSEENMRRALDTAEAVAPSLLWVDEIEKGLGGVSGNSGDSGTSQRVFGTFLTWMQEKTAPVFVVATANNIVGLPPELLRKGRFDEIFFVDLPTFNERRSIFKVHLSKRLSEGSIAGRGLVIDDALLDDLAEHTEGFVGAEIEQIVISGLFEAFYEKRPLTKEDLLHAAANTVPLSVTQAEQIISLRQWANVRAVAATSRDSRSSYKMDDGAADEADVKKSRGGRSLDF